VRTIRGLTLSISHAASGSTKAVAAQRIRALLLEELELFRTFLGAEAGEEAGAALSLFH